MIANEQQARSGRLALLAITAITLAALLLRVWKANWSLPFVPHPDEPAIMNVVLRMLRNGDPNPHFFYYPSLWIYVQSASAWLHLQWGIAQGLYTGAAQLPQTTDIATSVPGFFTWGRVATALAGTATVPVLYTLARKVGGSIAGFVVALLLTVNTFHIIHSHYITTDVPSELFVGLALVWTLAIVERGSWRDYLLAGALAGAAAGIKHHAALTAVAITVAHVIRWRGRFLHELGRLVGAAAAMIGVFLLTSPYIILAFPEFQRDLSHQLGDYAIGGHGDITGRWPVAYYLDFFEDQAVGTLSGLLALWGTIALVLRRDWRVVVLWSLLLAYLLIFLAQGNHWMRNIIATQIPLLALAGVGLADLLNRLRAALPRPAIAAITVGALVVLLLPASAGAVRYEQRLQRGDSRVQTLRWIEANVPPGVRVAGELKPIPGSTESRWTEVEYLPQHDLTWYRRQGYAYVITSSDVWRQWAPPEVYAGFMKTQPVAEFGSADQQMFGPKLLIFSTGLTAADVPNPPAGDTRFAGVRFLGAAIGTPDPDLPQVGIQPQRMLRAGGLLALRTFWQVEQPLTEDVFIFVHVRDAAGMTVAQRDAPPWQGRFPTSSWRSGTMVVDVNDVPLPANLAPGDYTISVGMFNPTTGGHPLLVIDGQPQAEGAVSLGTLTIAPP
ncbi:MAG TPA: glycosyltransferase family 39 protein [Herpetosiphonaceae bacterium]